MTLPRFLFGPALALTAAVTLAAPLSRTQQLDFHAEVPSRSLQGMATRSDGRLVPGPAIAPLDLKLNGTLLWSLAADGGDLLVGTGPEGQVLRITPGKKPGEATSSVLLDLPETHVFALTRLSDGSLLAGTSPQGGLVLAQGGKVVARAVLPVDSIFDLAVLPGAGDLTTVLVATGNPGRIYRVDLAKFRQGGDQPAKLANAEALAARGITLFGEIRDRNVRRLLRLADGRVIAGSAPKGNVYEFAATGGAPRILSENRNAEVCDLLPWDGGFFAALTFSSASGESRVNPAKPAKPEAQPGAAANANPPPPETPAPPPIFNDEAPRAERFAGRSQLLWFPDGGFPETAAARSNVAFYRLARQDGLVLIAGGENGELLGYEPAQRRTLLFPGSPSAQLNGLLPAPAAAGVFYAIANNPSALLRVDFAGGGPRSAETKRIDLGVPVQFGLLRFGPGSHVDPAAVEVKLRASFGSDETEGWTPWLTAESVDGGWQVPGLRGRHVQLRVATSAAAFELDKAELGFLRQNRRPQLQEFRLLSPNFGLVPAPEPAPQVVTTLGQLLQPSGRDDDKRRSPALASQVVPQPGIQVACWNVTDADDDNLTSTFSLRRRGESAWTDLAVASPESYVQFDISHLPEGTYDTKLVATEAAPRPAAERLSAVFETDALVVDRTPPVIGEPVVSRGGGRLRVTIRVQDAASRVAGAEFVLNNGAHGAVDQPDDGILDGRTETFTLDLPESQASGATSVEITAYDIAGNSAAKRVALP